MTTSNHTTDDRQTAERDRTDATGRRRRSAVRRFARIGFVVSVALLVVSTGAVPAAGQPTEHQPGFLVELSADGSARLTLTLTFALDDDAERRAFERLRTNESAQSNTEQQFADRFTAIATETERTTEREMRISDSTSEVETVDDGSTGIVSLSVTWHGLARQDGNDLVVSEPFASGFDSPYSVTVSGPDGYTLAEANSNPASKNQNGATWDAGTSFDGYRAVFSPSDTGAGQNGDSTSNDGGQPGFGAVGAVLAFLLGTVAIVRRR